MALVAGLTPLTVTAEPWTLSKTENLKVQITSSETRNLSRIISLHCLLVYNWDPGLVRLSGDKSRSIKTWRFRCNQNRWRHAASRSSSWKRQLAHLEPAAALLALGSRVSKLELELRLLRMWWWMCSSAAPAAEKNTGCSAASDNGLGAKSVRDFE